MAFDGMFLHKICEEIKSTALNCRIDKIHEPSREEIVIQMRAGGENKRLLLNAGASNPRIHFTKETIENPMSPPMFCMLLRKHIGNAKLVDLIQNELERCVYFKFETQNEFGDTVVMTLAVEIMGRYSNIILINENGRVIDSIKRIDDTVSSVRRVLPGVTYETPTAQDKLSILKTDSEEIINRIKNSNDTPLSKALLNTLQGASPLVARELSFFTTRGDDTQISLLTDDHYSRLNFALTNLKTALEGEYTPTMLCDQTKKPVEYSFIPINQYGHTLISSTHETLSELLDTFYKTKSTNQRMGQKSHDLLKLLANLSDRIIRKIAVQEKELKDCENRDTYRQYGDIISANLYRLQKGDRVAELENFYEEGSPIVKIKLDPMLTPTQNAQKYYIEYRKADTAEKMLTKLIENGKKEAEYIDSVFDSLSRATTEAELSAIKEELSQSGYLKRAKGYKNQKPEKLSYLRYISSDGFTILCGRNNVQNDKLTLKDSFNNDIWFHTHNIPGSHTVIVTENREVPNSTLEEAAHIAAYNSKARNSALVPVDYTLIKNIKKPSGAKYGMVIYETYQTVYITPDEDKVNSLLKK